MSMATEEATTEEQKPERATKVEHGKRREKPAKKYLGACL